MSVPGYPHLSSKKEHRSTAHGQNRYFNAVETEPVVAPAGAMVATQERVDIWGLTQVTLICKKESGAGTYSLTVKGSIDPAGPAVDFPTALAFTADGMHSFVANVPYLWIGGTNTNAVLSYQLYATR